VRRAAITVTSTSPPPSPPVKVKVGARITTTHLHHPEGVKVVEVKARIRAEKSRRCTAARRFATFKNQQPWSEVQGHGEAREESCTRIRSQGLLAQLPDIAGRINEALSIWRGQLDV
jgi:hypothetical protein